jgi:hypothetical protein
LVFGIWTVQKRFQTSSKLVKFAGLFLVSYVFLTLIRFLSDVDFWFDWTGYFLELQLGCALIGGYLLNRYYKKWVVWMVIGVVLGGGMFKSFRSLKLLRNGQNRTYQQEIMRMVSTVRLENDNERFFFSGSPVFWLSSALEQPLLQVRGGRDDVSTHKTWAMGAFQIREGESQVNLVQDWLKIFGVKYILIHDSNSQEYFHDYKNLDRFLNLKKVSEINGNILYSLDSSIARIADEKLLELTPPKDGADWETTAQYSSLIKKQQQMEFVSPTELKLNNIQLEPDEIISLAMTANFNWQINTGEGKISQDSFGNLVIKPKPEVSELTLKYVDTGYSLLPGIIITIVSFLGLIFTNKLVPLISLKLNITHLDSKNEEIDY